MLARLSIAILATALVPWWANASPGDLDTGFGALGKVTGPAGGARSVAVQGDGRIVVFADNYPAASVLRYAADGSPDLSFGNGGVAALPSPWLDNTNGGRQLLLQPDGRIVAVGYVDEGAQNAPELHVNVARFTAAGILDTSFGTNGITRFTGLRIGATVAAALQADGKIVVAGYLFSGSSEVFVVRFNADGSVDGGFGTNGGVSLRLSNSFEPRSLLVTADGKLLLAGFDSTGAAPKSTNIVARLNANGTFDTTFGQGGVVSIIGNGQFAVLQPDGKILFVGFDVRRLNADGTPDASFQVRCNPRPPSPQGSLCASNGTDFAAIQPDGKIVLGGVGVAPGSSDGSDFAVYRLNADGSDDTSFGSNGAAFARFSGLDQLYDVALQPNAHIVAVGEAFAGGARVAMARFLGDGSSASVPNYEGLWWGAPAGSESGWGINFAHQGDVIFATWFTYDASGKAFWLSMTANKAADGSFTGALYQTHGPAFSAVPFDPAAVTASQVGTGTIRFADSSDGTFEYTIGTTTQARAITRQVFGPMPTCVFGAQPNLALATQYQDLWWNSPAGSESGWGINLTQEGSIVFGTWFTYDATGAPLWLSVTASATGARSFSGPLYQTSGPAYNAQPFDPAKVVATQVGSATFTFTDGNAGTFAYTAFGISQVKPITREVFRAPGTVCR